MNLFYLSSYGPCSYQQIRFARWHVSLTITYRALIKVFLGKVTIALVQD